MDLVLEVRLLIAKHGVKEVYETLQTVMKKDYELLSSLLTQSEKTDIISPSIVSKSVEKTTEESNIAYESQSQTEVKIKKPVKTVVKEKESTDTINSLVPTKFNPGMKLLVQKDDSHEEEEKEDKRKPQFASAKEAKQWQKEQEELRREKNEKEGIDPESLLTPENLKRWVNEEKLAYSVIARDIIGIPEYRISEFAKQHGIISDTAKRRAAIIANRMKKRKS